LTESADTQSTQAHSCLFRPARFTGSRISHLTSRCGLPFMDRKEARPMDDESAAVDLDCCGKPWVVRLIIHRHDRIRNECNVQGICPYVPGTGSL
jgi:hypothetical protein